MILWIKCQMWAHVFSRCHSFPRLTVEHGSNHASHTFTSVDSYSLLTMTNSRCPQTIHTSLIPSFLYLVLLHAASNTWWFQRSCTLQHRPTECSATWRWGISQSISDRMLRIRTKRLDIMRHRNHPPLFTQPAPCYILHSTISLQ